MKHGFNASSLPDEQAASLPATVAEIGKIHFEGNIIPQPWYQYITLESGKPDLPAIIILAEIIYWYRPYQTLTKGGKPLLRKHFDGDMFQCSAAYFEAKFGLTKTQARRAITRLEEGGLIRREFRDVVIRGILRNNIMFIEPVPSAITAITHPPTVAEEVSAVSESLPLISETPSPVGETPSPVGETPSPVGETPSPVGETPSPVGETPSPVGERLSLKSHHTEITTETTTEITTTTTTPNPSSSNERTAEPETACRGGGAQDEQSEDQDGNHGEAEQATNEERTASKEEDHNGQPVELAYPAKLTEREQEDIATQIGTLPAEVVQQMLDAVQAKIQNGQVKTNPAALLRGIVRKYRIDPESFDPSIGFQIAEARRRRAEAEARLRAEAERRAREREAPRAAPGASEVRSRSIASMLRSLRGH